MYYVLHLLNSAEMQLYVLLTQTLKEVSDQIHALAALNTCKDHPIETCVCDSL
jgi:hypothetical protein